MTASGAAPGREVLLETGRLLLRPWRVAEADVARAVLDWARSSGYERLWASVWEWNTASRRVLAKVGFTETGRTEVDAVHGTTLFTTRPL